MESRILQREIVIGKIMDFIDGKDRSIAEISEELKIKRSTLNYYLKFMLNKSYITKTRIEEKVTGRPTMISLKKSFKDNPKQQHDLLLEFLEKVEKEKLTISQMKESGIDAKFGIPLSYAQFDGLIDKKIFITEKGKKYLKEKAE